MKKWITNLSNSEKISLVALTVAVSSIFLTIWQIQSIQEHNKISIKPMILLSSYYNNGKDKKYGWSISNEGVGPAIVKSFHIEIEGKKYFRWIDLIDYLGINNVYNVKFKNYNEGIVLTNPLSMEERKAISFKYIDNQKFMKKIENIEFKMCYCSLYEECWITTSKDVRSYRYDCNQKDTWIGYH